MSLNTGGTDQDSFPAKLELGFSESSSLPDLGVALIPLGLHHPVGQNLLPWFRENPLPSMCQSPRSLRSPFSHFISTKPLILLLGHQSPQVLVFRAEPHLSPLMQYPFCESPEKNLPYFNKCQNYFNNLLQGVRLYLCENSPFPSQSNTTLRSPPRAIALST